MEVHNEGSPIPPSLLENVFEPMVRHVRGAEDPREMSLGLGLHIARELVLAHGGSVAVTSTSSGGTTFSVRLPRRAVAISPSLEAVDRADRHDATGGIVAQ